MKLNKNETMIAIAVFAIFILLVAICFMAMNGRIGFFKKNGGSNGLTPTVVSVTDKWEIYRNEKYGFEIKYPDYFSVGKYAKASEAAADVYCGSLVADSFEVFSSEGQDLPSYVFSIYSNRWRLSPNDFFICKSKAIHGNDFDDSKIVKIEIFNIGQKDKNTALIVEGSVTTVLASVNGNIYEIRQEAEKNGVTDRAELDQMISTVNFFEIKTDPQVRKIEDFCVTKSKNEYGGGMLAFFQPIVSAGATAKEAFVGCQAVVGNQSEWLSEQPVSLFHVVDNGKGSYDTVWRDSTGKEGLDWLAANTLISAGDVDDDGLDEVLFTGKGQVYDQWCLYVPNDRKLFCATSITRADDGSGKDIAIEGKDCVADSNASNCHGQCTVLKRTLCFDKITELDPKYEIFKEYLKNNVAPGI